MRNIAKTFVGISLLGLLVACAAPEEDVVVVAPVEPEPVMSKY
ncbi:hypothetical protein SAMN05421688_2051 [Poseidonocella pacifica]|uniref:Lipoprotein n=1 Tax=Poseidonocella pacifica TaxID=871651 RepID=A0A1I0XAB0_9RHOB|nr:hypothetical protein [Poseidonocella pacifica]SFA97982.1 hypothetical protein SAMN05421688_2051 [Poseidonocella pacifica]